MGCIGSHLASTSGHIHRSQNVFSVLNVDEMGRNLQTGKLEVTETDLVLYVRGKAALTWPLRCLRRYGYDEDLFSFESGRRCPSGPGIYAFKCHRAQSLFNLLQAKIQGNPTALPPVPITPTPLNSQLNSASLSPTFDYVNISENQNNRGTIITTTNTTASLTATTTTHDQQDGNGTTTAVNNTSTSITQSQDNNHPLYMNVENHNPTNTPLQQQHHHQSHSSQNGPASSTRLRNYSCNGTFFDYPCSAVSNTSNSVYYSNVDCSLMQTTTTSSTAINNDVSLSAAEVNYAELDLETDSKITTMNSTTIAFNSMTTKVTNPKKLRLNNLGGSFGDDRFRAKQQIDPLMSTTPMSHDDDSIFSVVDPNTTPTSSVVAVSLNNIISSAGAASINNGNGPAAGYATIDFNRTAALSEIRNQLVNNRSNCNP